MKDDHPITQALYAAFNTQASAEYLATLEEGCSVTAGSMPVQRVRPLEKGYELSIATYRFSNDFATYEMIFNSRTRRLELMSIAEPGRVISWQYEAAAPTPRDALKIMRRMLSTLC